MFGIPDEFPVLTEEFADQIADRIARACRRRVRRSGRGHCCGRWRGHRRRVLAEAPLQQRSDVLKRAHFLDREIPNRYQLASLMVEDPKAVAQQLAIARVSLQGFHEYANVVPARERNRLKFVDPERDEQSCLVETIM